MKKSPADGIKVTINESNLADIQAEIDGPTGTPFEGGKFKLKLVLAGDYPRVPPKGYFITNIFHPNVSKGGDICVNTLKRDWSSDVTLSHVLQVIRCLLIVPFPESSLNDEAGKLFMTSYDEYAARARLYTDLHAARRGAASPAAEMAATSSAASGARCGTARMSLRRSGREVVVIGTRPVSRLHRRSTCAAVSPSRAATAAATSPTGPPAKHSFVTGASGA